jgi:type IV secretory pathway TrbF-like protein
MGEEWVEVFVTYDYLEAGMIRDLLESGGITVVLRSSKVTPYPVNVGRMGEIKVMVRGQDKEAAEQAIKAYREDM